MASKKVLRIQKALQLQQEGIIYKTMTDAEVKELIGYVNKKGLHNTMLKEGFKYDTHKGIFIPESDNSKEIAEQVQCTIDVVEGHVIDNKQKDEPKAETPAAEDNVVEVVPDMNKDIKEVIQDNKENLIYLLSNMDIIRNLIDNNRDKYRVSLSIDTNEELIQKNFKIYKSELNDFNKFVDEHKEYRVQELISQAIRDFINKYE